MPLVHNIDPLSLTRLVKDPMYFQLCGLLRELMGRGEFGAGRQFLTEREVAVRFGVSRVTANKALSNLVAEGALEFRKGVGSFVRGEGLDYDLQSLVSFTRKASLAGKQPSTQVLRFTRVGPGGAEERVRGELQVPSSEPLIYCERLRSADGVPLILERRYLVARYCGGLDRNGLKGSLYTVLKEQLGLRIRGAEQVLRSTNLSSPDAKLLRAKPGSAALWVHAVGWIEKPLWVEDTLYRGDLYEFRNQVGTLSAPRPAKAAISESTPPALLIGPGA